MNKFVFYRIGANLNVPSMPRVLILWYLIIYTVTLSQDYLCVQIQCRKESVTDSKISKLNLIGYQSGNVGGRGKLRD